MNKNKRWIFIQSHKTFKMICNFQKCFDLLYGMLICNFVRTAHVNFQRHAKKIFNILCFLLMAYIALNEYSEIFITYKCNIITKLEVKSIKMHWNLSLMHKKKINWDVHSNKIKYLFFYNLVINFTR